MIIYYTKSTVYIDSPEISWAVPFVHNGFDNRKKLVFASRIRRKKNYRYIKLDVALHDAILYFLGVTERSVL